MVILRLKGARAQMYLLKDLITINELSIMANSNKKNLSELKRTYSDWFFCQQCPKDSESPLDSFQILRLSSLDDVIIYNHFIHGISIQDLVTHKMHGICKNTIGNMYKCSKYSFHYQYFGKHNFQ